MDFNLSYTVLFNLEFSALLKNHSPASQRPKRGTKEAQKRPLVGTLFRWSVYNVSLALQLLFLIV